MIFGGQGQYEDQISEISNCALRRTGNLPKSFYMGACGAYNGKVWLCFDYYAENTCYSYDGNNVASGPSSNFAHSKISLADFRGNPMVVGSGEPDNKPSRLCTEDGHHSPTSLTLI